MITLTRFHIVCGLLSLSRVSPVQPQQSISPTQATPNVSLEPFNPESSPDFYEPKVEEIFASFFEDDPEFYFAWTIMAQAFRERGDAVLKNLCEAAHKRAGFGTVVVQTASMNAKTLKFKNETCYPNPKRIDVIACDYVEESGKNGETPAVTRNRFHICEGARSDCVFYLTPAKIDETAFYLDRHVCGLIIQ